MVCLESAILLSSSSDRCTLGDAGASARRAYLARPCWSVERPCPVSRAQRRAVKPHGCRSRGVALLCTAGISSDRFPWTERDYHKVSLQAISQQAHSAGTLILSRDDQVSLFDVPAHELSSVEKGETGAEALCIGVSGDTFQGIMNMMQRVPVQRPLSLDLLWQILERGHEISKRDWRLIRVAIVDLENNVFVGRLFFGDPDTGSTVWDCDCRPSDGLWLALKCKCPVYVNRVVWAKSATTIARLMSGSMEPETKEELSSAAALTRIRGDEPEPIKRLKREMAVALQEEDYATAARLRDHPFMQAHLRIRQLLFEGRSEAASAMELELTRLIDATRAPDCAD